MTFTEQTRTDALCSTGPAMHDPPCPCAGTQAQSRIPRVLGWQNVPLGGLVLAPFDSHCSLLNLRLAPFQIRYLFAIGARSPLTKGESQSPETSTPDRRAKWRLLSARVSGESHHAHPRAILQNRPTYFPSLPDLR